MEQINQNFIVRRNGHLDREWLVEHDAQVRREQLRQAGALILNHTHNVVKKLGHGVLVALETIDEAR